MAMTAVGQAGLACVGMACAAGAGFSLWSAYAEERRRRRHVRAMRAGGAPAGASRRGADARGDAGLLDGAALSLAVDLGRRIALGHGRRLLPARWTRAPRALGQARAAGLDGQLTPEGFGEARVRLALAGAGAGLAVGLVFSGELAALLLVAGGMAGWCLLPAAVGRRVRRRAQEMERHLPEMLDVVALGMRSGLSFDRSVELYVEHFDTLLAEAFGLAQRQWSCGLARRDDALRSVASSYDSPLLRRVVEGMVRSLRFGSSMAESLEAAAHEARVSYRARRQEQVAKAPVKMMVPTGVLILPAMLIMVLGPVLLELIEGF